MSQDLSSVMNGVMWMQVVMAMVFIGARMYTQHFIIHNIGWDDTFMLVNLVRVFPYTIMSLILLRMNPLTLDPDHIRWLCSLHLRRHSLRCRQEDRSHTQRRLL